MNFSSLIKASYTTKINHTTPIMDTVEPNELIKFHEANESGKSEYLLGIPANPKKCCGKKVRFTPINVSQKCIFP